MSFHERYAAYPYFIYDGPMETRIEYGANLKLDREMSIFLLLDSEAGREALSRLYCTDIEAVMPFNIPIILNAPTFRASSEHCQRLKIADDKQAIYKINQACITLLQSIRDRYPQYQDKIFITAPIGPKYAGFTPDHIENLDAEVGYHQVQIESVAKIGVDLISIAAMPGGLEAVGAAVAAGKTNLDYTVGFVVTEKGTLLDGTPIDTLIREIEQKVMKKPLGYIIGCTHPSIAKNALAEHKPEYKRIIGIKANGSAKPPKELLKLNKPEADEPEIFAEQLIKLGKNLGFKIYGGCCGTDDRHLAILANKLTHL